MKIKKKLGINYDDGKICEYKAKVTSVFFAIIILKDKDAFTDVNNYVCGNYNQSHFVNIRCVFS